MSLRFASVLLAVSCAAPAWADTFAVTLAPWNEVAAFGDARGSGFAIVTVDGTTVSYTLYVRGITPRSGWIQDGGASAEGTPVVSLGLYVNPLHGEVVSGSATTTRDVADRIKADPASFSVNLATDDFPAGALRGPLAPPAATRVVLPTVAKARGLNGSNFVTDLSLVNRGAAGAPAQVVLDFFPSSASGLAGPAASKTVSVAPGAELVLADLLDSQFGATGDGALRVTAPRGVSTTARVFNDQRASGAGTTGLLVPASDLSDLAASGVLPLLSNASPSEVGAGIGYRTNVGYFNPYAGTATVTFTAVRSSDGATLGSATRAIPGLSRVQQPVFDLIPTVPDADRRQESFYVTFTASAGSALFAYAAVVDNRTGDGIYVKAVPAPGGEPPASQAPSSVTGTWSGGGQGFKMTWRLVQHGSAITGLVSVEAVNAFDAVEFLRGTFDGTAITLDGVGLPGDHSFGGCTDLVTFTGLVTNLTTIKGRYDETGTCDPGDSGSFTLTRM